MPLSVGHPAPPSTPLVRPRTAVCSRGARARRERSGSVAEADGYSGAHRAAAPHASTYATHTAHAAGELATSSHSPPDAHPSPPAVPFHVEHGGVLPPLHSMCPCTPCRAMLNYAREPAALHSMRPCTPCCALLHYAREPAALHSRHPCTPRCAPLHCAPQKCPSLGRGDPPKNHASLRGGNAHERKAPPPSAVAWAKPARAGHPCAAQRQGVREHAQGGALRYAGHSTTRMGTFRSVSGALALRSAWHSTTRMGTFRSVSGALALRSAWHSTTRMGTWSGVGGAPRHVPRGTARQTGEG